MKLKSKLFAGVVGVSMVLSMVAVPASAQTTAELTVMINSLLAQIATLQAQIGGGASTGGASVNFTSDLTVGSKGADVTALQNLLTSNGYLTMPAGVAMGYFGMLTKSAVMKWQASLGISPASGYFGPISRAKANAAVVVGPVTPGTPAVPGGIKTPGVEGTLTVTANNSGLASTVYEADKMVGILGTTVEAKNSDISLQRVKINLGTDSKIYSKGYTKLYVTEGSNVLASIDLNSSTVVKESSTYFITITGFNYVIPKNTKKSIVIKADVMSAIDSGDRTTLSSIALLIPANGLRGVDGAGIDQYAPTAALASRSVTFSADLTESATLSVSLNSSSPRKAEVIAPNGSSDNELDNLTVLVFDVKAEKDAVKITDLIVGIWKTGSGAATASTSVSIYDGATELDSVSMSGPNATFTNIDYVVPKDTTKTLTVKVDIRAANATVANFVASTTAAMVTAENSAGDSITESGSATGYQIGVRNAGAEVTLVSKSITSNGVPQSSTANTFSTSSLTASFTVKIKAVGSSIDLGTVASSAPVFASSTTGFKAYVNGSSSHAAGGAATTTSFTIPTGAGCTTGSLTNGCTLADGSEVTVTATYQMFGRAANGTTMNPAGLYAVGIEAVQWTNSSGAAQSTVFMAGETDWRTAEVAFP